MNDIHIIHDQHQRQATLTPNSVALATPNTISGLKTHFYSTNWAANKILK